MRNPHRERTVTKPDPNKSDVQDAVDGLIDVTFDVLRGHASHASRLFSGAVDKGGEIDPFEELGQFLTRATGDIGRTVKASQEFFEKLSSTPKDKTEPEVGPSQTDGAEAVEHICTHDETVGPFAAGTAVQVMPLRHRGDLAPAIAVGQITAKPGPTTSGQFSDIQIAVSCSGEARGLYEGKLIVGSQEISYNIYIDPD